MNDSLSWHGSDVDVSTLDRKLSGLWKEMAARHQHVHPVRTQIFNLVVYTADRAEADRIVDRLNALKQAHPSRTVILVADRFQSCSAIDADVTVGFGLGEHHAPKCREQVLLTVRGRAADHLASVVLPLKIAELPTYLWWPGQPLFGHRMFHRLVSAADRLVVDSAEFEAPGDGLADLANLCAGRHSVNDFTWARLTPWREVMAQFFDSQEMRPYVDGIQSLRLEFGAGKAETSRVTAGVLLLLGWVSSCLDWEPETTIDRAVNQNVTFTLLQRERLIPVDVVFVDHGSAATSHFMGLEIIAHAPGKPETRFIVTRADDLQTVHVCVEIAGDTESTRVVPLLTHSDEELLADELAVTGNDSLYGTVVHVASRLAGREVWRST
ncbi:MAG: glucose-6-phosphate dehydrogenase assembly protein OpcA [Chloroflexota bacterium]